MNSLLTCRTIKQFQDWANLNPNHRIIFYTDDVDELFAYMQDDKTISGLGKLESKPQDATWGERFFHMLDPDGYKMSFATPIGNE